jgi:hypothetical protein
MNYLNNCLFINLEKRKDRLEHVTTQLEKMNINGERFNAVETKDGAIGCTMSHIKCLELAKERDYEHVFICEDDITFLNPDLLKTNLQRFIDMHINWDVIIIGGNNCPPYQTIEDFAIKIGNCQTTTGYIVKKHYLDTLITNFRESATNLIKDPKNKRMFALDVYWKRLQQIHQWYMIVPITVIQVESYSDIENRVTDYKGLMLDLEKKWIFQRQQMRHF